MRIFFAVFFLAFFSCRSKTAVPKDIIPVAKMTDLLWDVMLADELVVQRYRTAGEAQKLDTSTVLYQQIVKAHGTTQQEFKKSLQFYEGRPDLLQIIIDSLQNRSMIPAVTYKKDTASSKKDSLSRKLFQRPMVRPISDPSR